MMRNRERAPLISEPPDSNLRACVIVPAKNEEDLLPFALHALAEQRTLEGKPLAFDAHEIILLINNSTDGTRRAAESVHRLYPSLPLHVVERNFDKSHAHIGYVRRLLMDEAARRLEAVGRADGLILSTDSDSRVAPNWICRNADEISRGAEVVGGRVVIAATDQDAMDLSTREAYQHDTLYRRLICWMEDRFDPEPHDPWPKHHQHFGASLAITARAYRATSGLPPRRYLEDVAFYDVLMRHDIRIRHSNLVRVFTSGRVGGRTRFGLSRQLKQWQGTRKGLLNARVESARFLEELFKTRRQLRTLWRELHGMQAPSRLAASVVAEALGVPARWLVETAQCARYFGLLLEQLRFYERFRRMRPEFVRLAPLEKVVAELRSAFIVGRRASTPAAHRVRDAVLS
jgi:hypothetical protein